MKDYHFAKLSQANYKIATHPGSANLRLASQAYEILVIPLSFIPEEYKKGYSKLTQLIEESCKEADKLGIGLRPYRLGRIRNMTAAKYIKLLLDVELSMGVII